MIIKSASQLKRYQAAGSLSVKILRQLVAKVQPGIYPTEVDNLAKKLCRQHQVRPAFLGVAHGQSVFEYATCVCVNDVAVHAIPSQTQAFQIGDVVKVDFGLVYQGFYTDLCVTIGVKKISREQEKLILTAKEAVRSAINQAVPGNTTGDVGHLIHSLAKKNGFDVLKQYTGHGIGKGLHDQPIIPAYGQPKQGKVFQPGMVICLEAQLVTGSDQVAVAEDGWTVKTVDGGLVAMFEYMVVVQDKPLVLTDTFDFPLVV